MLFRRIFAAVAVVLVMAACVGCDASAPPVEESATSSPSSSPEVSQTPETTPSPEATEEASTESASSEPTDEMSKEPATLPDEAATPDATISFLGNITNIDPEEDIVTVAEEWLADGESDSTGTADPTSAVDCLLNEDTIIIDAINGTKVEKEDLQGGMRVFAFVSPMMTRSIPPQSNCYALITGISDDGTGVASYVKAMEVTTAENGNLVVLNQNADLYVTIPADMTIDALDGGEASLEDITEGSVFIAWYDVVAESYPGQTTATKVVLCPAPEAQPSESASASAES